ncbi:hypothetical protein GBA65_13165 [Rubrobacter marinus]|uniref:Uncharacterized protein n=1 Tax=Rubrobacter marinus TaxID=2653852 RepID=A0A6G8PYL3_9ACTN|nr:hypothetical protein [Rubrobacter marinus]QIN79301.1 hypothetical protein GBA65_13165 [Rubrobacter marinus]
MGLFPSCLLALALILAQPVSYFAWFEGEHVTLEQAKLHDEAIGSGNLHHHGLGSKAVPGFGGAQGRPVADLDASTPDLAPTANLAALSPDSLKSVPVEKTASPHRADDARPLFRQASALANQHFPSVPHRPPIFPA